MLILITASLELLGICVCYNVSVLIKNSYTLPHLNSITTTFSVVLCTLYKQRDSTKKIYLYMET